MATQIRHTQFGHLVRLLSSKKYFQYPDELDSSLSKSCYHRHPSPVPSKSELVCGEEERSISHGDYAVQERGLVDWYGPNDPENPQNWSSTWKILITGQICLMNFTFYIASSIYTPGEHNIMQDFGVSETVATLGLSVFSLGYGLGPMLWSPLSEMPKVGRNNIYFYTMLCFVLLQLPTGFAVNMPMFLVLRALTGFMGSPALATGGASIADMYQPAYVPYGIAIWGSFGLCGPVFGPILGGFAAQADGWRLTIWIVAWLVTPTLMILFFFMPETSAATILYRRARRLRKATGDERLRSQSEVDAEHHTTKDRLVVLGRAFTLTFSEPIVFVLDLYTALVYGVLFTWFESFPFVFSNIYHFTLGEQGLVFLGLFVSTLIVLPLFLLWTRYGIAPQFDKPNFRPEIVLPPTFFGAVALPACLFWYGWSARESVHWIVPIIGSSLFTISIITLFNPVLTYLGIAYPRYAASIFAGNGLFRASFGAIFPLFARQLFYKLGVAGGNSLLAGVSVAFMVLPFIFYKYGPKLRSMSRNARCDEDD